MQNVRLFRKRIIPSECIELKDDVLVEINDDYILTKWNALKPKKDLHHGASCYFLKDGIKISKFYTADNTLMYWYCDIVSYTYNSSDNTYLFTDLLADVIIYPDGTYKVVDIDEIAEALSKGLIDSETACDSLNKLDSLLHSLYENNLSDYKAPLMNL